MCAHSTHSTATSMVAVPAFALDGGNRSAFTTAMIIIVEAFKEALAMRRAAAKSHLLFDE